MRYLKRRKEKRLLLEESFTLMTGGNFAVCTKTFVLLLEELWGVVLMNTVFVS